MEFDKEGKRIRTGKGPKPQLCPHGILGKSKCRACMRENERRYYDKKRKRNPKPEPKPEKSKPEKSKAKICENCGLEITSSNYKFCNRACSVAYRGKMNHQKSLEREKAKKEEAPKGKCPMLGRCLKASGIDCSKRNHLGCDFYKRTFTEKYARRGYFQDESVVGEIKVVN